MSEPNAIMLCPSRGRPEAARELMDSWRDFADFAKLVVIIDADDPEFLNYRGGKNGCASVLPVSPTIDPGAVARALKNPFPFPAYAPGAVGASHPGCNYLAVGFCNKCGWTDPAPRGIGPLVNHVAAELCADPALDYVGFLGDDHRPRTKGWDTLLVSALGSRPGVAYGDDLFQGERMATACLMSADIVRAIGFMNPPGLTHLYLDNFWMLLGQTVLNLPYVPEVIIEHLHPYAGKAEWDEGHVRVNSQDMNSRDERAWHRFRTEDWPQHRARLIAGLSQLAPK